MWLVVAGKLYYVPKCDFALKADNKCYSNYEIPSLAVRFWNVADLFVSVIGKKAAWKDTVLTHSSL